MWMVKFELAAVWVITTKSTNFVLQCLKSSNNLQYCNTCTDYIPPIKNLPDILIYQVLTFQTTSKAFFTPNFKM
jgi:hypothetical protein